MKIVKSESWEECEKKLLRALEDSEANEHYSCLFRGHACSCWRLCTTLERAGKTGISLADYYNLILKISPQIETFTGLAWSLPDSAPLKLNRYDFRYDFTRCSIPALGYMEYLRHHGFPSPLIDWTRSPYIAAYFAFAGSRPLNDSNSVAIYALSECYQGGEVEGRPHIYSLRRDIKSHRRHYLQQSVYTICAKFVNHNEWLLSPHEHADPEPEPPLPKQYALTKYFVPARERKKILSRLDARYNVNASSLFGSEESLMETLKFREFDLA